MEQIAFRIPRRSLPLCGNAARRRRGNATFGYGFGVCRKEKRQLKRRRRLAAESDSVVNGAKKKRLPFSSRWRSSDEATLPKVGAVGLEELEIYFRIPSAVIL